MQTEYKLGRNPLKKLKKQEAQKPQESQENLENQQAFENQDSQGIIERSFDTSLLGPVFEKTRSPSALDKIREMQIQVHWPELIQSTLDTRVGVQLKKLTRFFSRS